MKTLIIKDLKLSHPAILCLLLLYLILPVLIAFVLCLNDQSHASLFQLFVISLEVSSWTCLGASLLIIPAFGAVAFAKERQDRSAEFLACMPVTQAEVVTSKLLVTVVLGLLPWALSASMVIIGAIADQTWLWPPFNSLATSAAFSFIQIEIPLLGFSWFLSSLARTPAFATAVTLLVALLLLITYMLLRIEDDATRGHTADGVTTVIALVGGIGGVVAGTLIALKRTSP